MADSPIPHYSHHRRDNNCRSSDTRLPYWTVMLLALLVIPAVSKESVAEDRILLRDGFELAGKVEIEANRIIVHAGPRIYYVGSRQLLRPQTTQDELPEVFRLTQPVAQRARPIVALNGLVRSEEFDDYGRRNVVVRDETDREVALIQAITEIHSDHVVVESVERSWRFSLALEQIPTAVLVACLKRATRDDLPDAIRLISFLNCAGRFDAAGEQLDLAVKKFPEETSRFEELRVDRESRVADKALTHIRRAIDVGQWGKARQLVDALENFSVPAARQPTVQLYSDQLAQNQQTVAAAQEVLHRDLQLIPAMTEGLEDARQAVGEIAQYLAPSLLERLQPAVNFAEDKSVSPQQRLALAITGWVLGPTLAQTDWNAAIRIWRQRVILQLALTASGELPLQQALAALKAQQVPLDLIVQMVPFLPAPSTEIPAETVVPIKVAAAEGPPLRYHLWLPPEYQPHRRYPMIVTLHGLNSTPSQQIETWKSFAGDFGYILVAPEYRAAQNRPYEYSLEEHRKVLDTLRHVRRSFAVDSDRVFLSGHELGGVAAWDIGMSHPDQFAGLIPFTGSPAFYCKHYWPNISQLPVYAVEGGFNGGNPAQTQNEFLRYFANGYNALYVEYPGRGREFYNAEMPKIFEWMTGKRRKAVPLEFEAVAARPSERRFYWLDIESFLQTATVAPQLFHRSRFRSAKLSAKVTDNNQVLVECSGVDKLSIKIPYGLIHLDDPKILIRCNRKIVHKGPIEPDYETMVRELRETGDRTNLILQSFHVGRL